jgi:16S rRNA (uracil1498-N3)-methyltransferase
MSHRYYFERSDDSDLVRLCGPEAHHMLHVMRGRRGDTVRLFDGSGREFQAEISELGRDWVELKVLTSAIVDRELEGRLTVAVALPKGDRQRWLVEKLVEIGVQRVTPLIVERSVAQFNQNVRARIERFAIEASKQCGRNRLMEISDAQSADVYFRGENSSTKLIAQPGAVAASSNQWSPQIAIAIGPEGGFSLDELAVATHSGWQPVGLGPRTLRVETAAIYLSSLAAAHLESCRQSTAPGPRSQTT